MGSGSPSLTGTAPVAKGTMNNKALLPAKDAEIEIKFSQGKMSAEISIKPPNETGRHADRQMILEALEKAGVVYGIDHDAVDSLAVPIYNRFMEVAKGRPAVHGEDGICEEHFEREKQSKFGTKREDGTIDYRELSLITEVAKGQAICTITPPSEGQPGMNIVGEKLEQRVGKKAVVPAGDGTRISQDGQRLEATVSGNLVFRNGRFYVETVYRVNDIDYEVGNITFSGDVYVNGDMQDGFKIISGGDVVLRGRVGSVEIKAKNVTIEKGINGTGRAVVEAIDTLKAGFIENCRVIAGKKIKASSIINSVVECEGDVEVTSGKGLICGGKITAFGSITANAIGNEFNTLTIIAIGVTPRLLAERKKLVEQLADVEKHIDSMSKNIEYIERLVADNRPVPSDRIQLLQRTQIQLPLSEKKKSQLISSITNMDIRMSEIGNSCLTARIIHPPTKISIGALSTNCIETKSKVRVYRSSSGELVFGTY